MNAKDQIHALVESWHQCCHRPVTACAPIGGPTRPQIGGFRKLREELEYLDRVKYERYVPTLYSKHPITFFERLHAWLDNALLSDEDKRHLFEFASHLAFFSFDDFVAMFRSAFAGPVSRWCINIAGIRLDQPGWMKRLDNERFEKTWYCPVTDSLLISVFHHANSISGKERRPAFRELKYFSDANKINNYLNKKKIARVVLLEDCVCTGDQCFNTVKWAVDNLGVPILFCPMIIADEAVQRFLDFKLSLPEPGFFEINPVFKLGADCFLLRSDGPSPQLYEHVRALAERVHAELAKEGQAPKEGALGYWNEASREKGATIVLFSNTPNNTVSLVHHDSRLWKPLFPRVTR